MPTPWDCSLGIYYNTAKDGHGNTTFRTSQECQECKQCLEERSLNKYNIHSGLANHDKNGMVDAAYTYTFVYVGKPR
uniref:Uncharacterized protein n=1 Tax=Trichobilharzia regenti TaxID=157069 RepID=A0AA85JXX0_TRIRE|nr:unnamed protein product [Trichobilharzia regenti]